MICPEYTQIMTSGQSSLLVSAGMVFLGSGAGIGIGSGRRGENSKSGFELVYGGNPFGVGMVCRVSATDRRENFSRLMMRFFPIEDVVANDPGIYGYRYEVEFYAITLLDSLFVDGGDQRLFEVVGLTERK